MVLTINPEQVYPERVISDHKLPVNALVFSPDGKLLVSAGDDHRICVWDLDAQAARTNFVKRFEGPPISIAFVPVENSDNLAFVVGHADGSLSLFKRLHVNCAFERVTVFSTSHTHTGVQDIAVHAGTNRIMTLGDGFAELWELDFGGPSPFKSIGSMSPSRYTAVKAFFYDEGRHAAICFLELHEIHLYSVSPWKHLQTKRVVSRIGGAYYCPASRTLLVANLENGVDQYLFPQLERIKTFDWPLLERIILHITTVGEGRYILAGGDNGFARLYGPSDTTLIMLHHEGVDRVQAVAAFSTATRFRLATAATAPEERGIIKIWSQHKAESVLSVPTAPVIPLWAKVVSYAILVLLLAGNLTYLRGGVMPGWRASYRIVVPHPAAAMSEADARAEAYLKPRDRDQAEVIATKISRFTVPL